MSLDSWTHTESPSGLSSFREETKLVSRSELLAGGLDPIEVYKEAELNEAFRVFWGQRDRQLVLVGLGVACGVKVEGPGRFEQVREWYQELIEHADVDGGDHAGTGPLAIGGFRFDPDAETSPEWERFGDGMMVVPRVCYAWTSEGCWVTENRLLQPNGEGSFLADTRCGNGTSVEKGSEIKITDWLKSVERALESVRRGEADKVVLARRALVEPGNEFDVSRALDRLMEAETRCSVFAFGVGPDTFIGASPEPLVNLSDGRMECICHAGSAARGSTPDEDESLGDELLKDAKEHREHVLATRRVEQVLRGLCEELTWDSEPRLSKLNYVQHLSTTFRGSNALNRHILEFVDALHPTPAVAGVPTKRAMERIRELEGMDRGWYSGPVGWMGHKGQGEFAIAIRSGLVTGDRAYLYGGAGIVDGSEVGKEFAETELKMLGLRKALGLIAE